jgi:hypothetical protein
VEEEENPGLEVLLPEWLWASHVTSLSLSLTSVQMDIGSPASLGPVGEWSE